jgi:Glycosyltransferase family 87
MTMPRALSRWGRPALAGGLLLASLAFLLHTGPRLLTADAWPVEDFVCFWAGGRLTAEGANPYSEELQYTLQHAEGSPRSYALPFYYPPWALPVMVPFGQLSFPIARLLWVVAIVILLLICLNGLARVYALPARWQMATFILCFSFFPALLMVRLGQRTFLPLLGAVGFLYFLKQKRDFWAGTALALLGMKVHLSLVLLPVVALWVLAGKRWQVLLGGLLAGLVLVLLPLAWNPALYGLYFDYMSHTRPIFLAPTPGALLAHVGRHHGLRFLPALLGMCWGGLYWRQHRQDWDWAERLPLLLFVSLLAAPYGWSYDLVLLFVPLVQVAARLGQNPDRLRIALAVGFLVMINGAAVAINFCWRLPEHWFFWLAPTLFVGYLATGAQRHLSLNQSVNRPVPLGTR